MEIAALVLFPDEHLGWIPFAVRSALASHRRRPADAIYSTSPPITGHLVAGLVARRTGLPWVADFRDPWRGNPFLPALPRPHRWLQRRIEGWIIRNASHVVTATPSLTGMLRDRYPEAATRISTITNGYDGEETTRVERAPRSDEHVHVVYTGRVYGGTLEPFLAGVRLLIDQDPAAGDRLRVEFIGWLDAESEAVATRHLLDPRVARVVTFVGYRPRSEAMVAVASADAALYMLPGDPRKAYIIGGKLFEYIGLGVPVLAVVPLGDARDVLASLDWGIAVEPTPAVVAGGLRQLLETAPPHGTADPSRRYDRRTLTRDLANVLDAVTRPAPG